MTPEEKNLLERTFKMAEENNSILKSIRRGNRFSIVMRLLYWGVIIASSIGAYYFIQPYLQQVLGMYNDAQSNIQSVKNVLGK